MEEEVNRPSARLQRVGLPARGLGPKAHLLWRTCVALACIVLTTALVYWERDGYRDVDENGISFLDAAYYATVTLSTTGYGDITPVSELARLTNILLITPLRFIFLIVLIGTTVEQLTSEARRDRRIDKWRKRVKGHTVILGYGVKGRSALKTLIASGTQPKNIVVVANDRFAVNDAIRDGAIGVVGDATKTEVLKNDAQIEKAASIVVAADRDDNAIMITLNCRRLNPNARIVAAAKESTSSALLRQSGANNVITTSEAAGNIMALSLNSPVAGTIVEDLLESGRGLEVAERPITRAEFGRSTAKFNDEGADDRQLVLAVIRNDVTYPFHETGNMILATGDRVVVIRPTDVARETH